MSLNNLLSRKPSVSTLYFYLTTFFNVVFILFSISLLNKDGLHVFINSDTLYLPSIYQDITEFGHSLKGWHLNPAPNFFPDMLLYAAIAIFSNNFIVSIIAFAVIQYLLIIFLANKALQPCVSQKERYFTLAIGNLFLALIPLSTYFANDFHFSFHLISNAYHNGAFINALIALNLFIRFIKNKSYTQLSLLLLTIFVGVLSDRFFIFYFILPSVGVAIFSLLDKTIRKNSIIYIGSTILVTGISITTFNLLKVYKLLVVFSRTLKLTPQIILDAWNMFAEQFSYYFSEFDSRSFALYFSLISIFLLGRFIYVRIKNKTLRVLDSKFLVVLFLFCFIPLVLFIPILLGVYTGWDTIRYNFQTIIVGLLFVGLTLNYSANKTKQAITFVLTPSVLIALVFTCSILFSKTFYTGLNGVVNFYPEKVETIDKITEEHNLQFGVAPYWTAKYTMMLSKNNVRTYTCYPEMTPWYHACNEKWFYFNPYTKDSVDFNFVVIDGPKHEKFFKELLGEPLEIIDTNAVKIYITKPFRYNPKTYLPYYINN